VDTRYLTRKLRDGGTQKAALSTRGTPPAELLAMARQWPGLDGCDTVKEVTVTRNYAWEGDPGEQWVARRADQAATHIVAFDFGIKRNILRHLAAYGARVTVVPAYTLARDVLKMNPQGVFLSNGPGDPEGLPYAVNAVRGLLDAHIPILGICLGHQLLGMAIGGTKRRLKFGHHGGNHPVQHLPTGKVLITAQNHNYCIETDSLDPAAVEVTYASLNDGSLEGMRLKGQPVLSVQFHPEAAPGPHDAHDIFGEFFRLVREAGNV
jgi:carbamoyl-phosphate synthase small subunit